MKFYLLLFVLIFFTSLFGQDTIKIIEIKGYDGFTTEVKLNLNPDNISKLNFWVGFNVGVDRFSFGGVSYYSAKKHLANLHLGPGLSYDGVIFLKNWLKPKIIKNSIPIKHGVGYSMLNVANKRYSLGIHYGGGRFNYYQNVKVNNVIVGLTLLKAIGGNAEVKMNGVTRKGFNRITYNLDFIRYFGHTYKPPSSFYNVIEVGEFVVPGNSFNTYTLDEYYSEKEKNKLNYGVKIYLEGYSGLWSRKGIIGLHYVFGFGIPPDGSLGGGVDLGLGLSFSFL
jgi:hypothetical protein